MANRSSTTRWGIRGQAQKRGGHCKIQILLFSHYNFESLWCSGSVCQVLSIPAAVSAGQSGQAGRDGGTPGPHLYPERGGVYFNIPRASRQRALIINKLGTRHGVPQGDQPEQSQNRETDRERRGCVKRNRERQGGGREQGGEDRREQTGEIWQ